MKGRLDRRRRRLVITLGSLGVVLAVVVAWAVNRAPEAAPYLPGEETEGITNSLGRDLPPDRPQVMFTDVAADRGIAFQHFTATRTVQLPEDMGSGAAWGDYDGDGWYDLYLVNLAGNVGGDGQPSGSATSRLYRNLGNGSFEDVTESTGAGLSNLGMGAAWADYDRDGDDDLAVSSFGRLELLRNDDGHFTAQGDAAGVSVRDSFWTGLAWGDYDADGDPDLYAAAYVDYVHDPDDVARSSEQYGTTTPFTINPSSYPPLPNLLLQNQGDGTFVDVTDAAGVANDQGRSLAATWTDLNNDGRLDLYVANDISASALYLNRGDGTFQESAAESLVADYRGAMGIAVGDWNADSDLDLFITHWIAQENALYDNLTADQSAAFVASGDGLSRPMFGDVADAHGLGQSSLDFVGWGDGFIDFDLDGRLDLFAVNGHTLQDPDEPTALVPMRGQLYWNSGTDGFVDVGEVSGPGFAFEAVSRGAAVADFDSDGDADVVVIDHGAPARLLMADGATNAWLKVRLEGRENRDVTGARVEVVSASGTQMQEYGTGGSYLSQHAPEALFGLGQSESADRVLVTWPGGATEEIADVPARHTVVFTEGEGARTVTMGRVPAPGGGAAGSGLGGGTSAGSDEGLRGGASGAPEGELADPGLSALGAPTPSDERARVQAFWQVFRAAQENMRGAQDWEKAAEGFRRALELDPAHQDSMYYLGSSLYELGDYQGALEQFELLAATEPMSLRANLQIGTLRSMPAAGDALDLEAAARSLARAVEINPEESGALTRLGGVQLALGQMDEAETSLRQARTLNFRSHEAFYLGGYVAWQRGQTDEALALLAKAVEIVQPQEGAAQPMSEGDTKRADRSALVSAAHAERQLFGALLSELGSVTPEVVDEAFAAEEYARLATYLEALGASEDRARG